MRIGIDGRELSGEPTGVGRLLAGLLDSWPADDELLLYSRTRVPWRFLGGQRRGRVVPGPRRLPGALWEQTVLPMALRRDGVSALFSPAYSMPVAAPCRVVVGMHDCASEATPWEFGWRERWRRRLAARSASRRATFVVAGSRFSAAEIRRWYGTPHRRIVTAPYGLAEGFGDVDANEIARVRERYCMPQRSVLFVGAPLVRRNLAGLIDAVADLRPGRGDLRLCVVGPERRASDELRARAGGRDVRDAVQWLGYVPEADLPAVYAAATVMAYPSQYEGFGFPALEALACGTPVVASRAGSLDEIFRGRAWLVDDDPEAWRTALGRLLDDPEERDRWLRRGRRWAQQRSWGPAARLVRRLLIDAAQRNGTGPR